MVLMHVLVAGTMASDSLNVYVYSITQTQYAHKNKAAVSLVQRQLC